MNGYLYKDIKSVFRQKHKRPIYGLGYFGRREKVGSKSPENQTVENALDVFVMDLLQI